MTSFSWDDRLISIVSPVAACLWRLARCDQSCPDGVSESMNLRYEEWGEERLIEFAKTCHGLPVAESIKRILAAAQAFAAGASQHDDMTLVVLRVA